MDGRLPPTTRRHILRVLAPNGRVVLRQTGNHVVLSRADGSGRLIVPNHLGDLDFGTLRSILRQAGLSSERFRDLRSKRS